MGSGGHGINLAVKSVIMKFKDLSMICNAEDLSPDQMAAVETLLGRRVQAGEAVSVRTFEPVGISHHRRLEIADELRKYFAEEHLCKASKAISYAPGRSERWPLRPKISVLFRPDLSGRPIYRCAAELRRTPQRSKIRRFLCSEFALEFLLPPSGRRRRLHRHISQPQRWPSTLQ